MNRSTFAFDASDRDAVYRAIYTRRDVRTYLPQPVSPALLRRLLEAAHRAPSVGFMQPWNFLLVDDPALRQSVHAHVVGVQAEAGAAYQGDQRSVYDSLKLQGILDAPLNLLVTCDPTRGGEVLGRATMRETDVYSTCLAIQNLWLAARAEGLGVGWVSLMRPDVLRPLFGIPEHVILVAWLTIGYPVELPETPLLERVGWRQRQPLDALVFQDRWGENANLAPGEAPAPTPAPAPPPPPSRVPELASARNDRLTKPPGSLGQLEAVALKVAAVQGRDYPATERRVLVLMAGDHGVVAEGVSAYRPELTARMVLQFAAGGGVINSFARQSGVEVQVADLGVDCDLSAATAVLHHKVRRGTRNMVLEPAMSAPELDAALAAGRALLPEADLVGVGEMGIGNSTSAAALAAALLGLPPEIVVGRGTGIGDQTWTRKVEAVRRALDLHRDTDPLLALGGLEIAGLVGLMLEAAERRIPVVLDGFITGVAALAAVRRDARVADVLIAGHRSAEAGHAPVLDALGLQPLLDLGLRLGEGSGALLAMGLVRSACQVLSEVKTFEEAGITEPLDRRGRQ